MKKAIAIGMIFLVSTIGAFVNTNANTTTNWLRVGLKSTYEMVGAIHIKNQSVTMGYTLNQVYREERSLYSSSGFAFTPATGNYYLSNESFLSYEAAMQVVLKLREQNVPAFTGTIAPQTWKIYVGGSHNADEVNRLLPVIDGAHNVVYHLITDNGKRVLLSGSEDQIILDNGSLHPQFMGVGGNEVNLIDLGINQYRGRMEIGRYDKAGVTAINEISIDEYLYGVVPSEVSPSWPVESLKAQAIAARTYAIYAKDVTKRYIGEPYDLCDTTASQVYKGYSREHVATNNAVLATSGRMLYYQGVLINPQYYSTSGGSTERSENVWVTPLPYFVSVSDIYETTPAKAPWIMALTSSEIEDKLQRNGINIGRIVDVTVMYYSDAGRAMEVEIRGTNGVHTLTKESIRTNLGLFSRKFKVVKAGTLPVQSLSVLSSSKQSNVRVQDMYVLDENGQTSKLNNQLEQIIVFGGSDIENYPLITTNASDHFYFAGQGYGHGVGMSQSGAKGMADAGFNYVDILTHYYQGVKIQ